MKRGKCHLHEHSLTTSMSEADRKLAIRLCTPKLLEYREFYSLMYMLRVGALISHS